MKIVGVLSTFIWSINAYQLFTSPDSPLIMNALISLYFIAGWMFPGDVSSLSHIHDLDLDLPEECFFAFQPTMADSLWLLNPAFKKLRDYTLVNPGEEMLTKAYEHYKNTLKCIFYKGNSRLRHF